jgi:hypothetical protein
LGSNIITNYNNLIKSGIGLNNIPILIGKNSQQNSLFTGSISMSRIVKSALYYGSTYTVPTLTQIESQYQNPIPTIKLNGLNIINVILNQTYTENGATVSDIFNDNLSYIINGTVDSTTIGVYTLTYTVSNPYGTASVSRTINVVANIYPISYDTTNGYLGPLYNNYNAMSGVDWTIECWVNPTIVPSGDAIILFDFSGYPRPRTYQINSSFVCLLYPDYTMSIFDIYNWSWYGRSTIKLVQNKWNHIGWMRSNNSLYVFINGVINNLGSSITFLNNLSCMNSLVICADNYWLTQNGNTTQSNRFLGQISQPLITLGAKYSIKGFTPQWNLRPITWNNVLFWLDNIVDQITGQTIKIQNTVIKNTLLVSPIAPIINLNGSNPNYLLKSTTYNELGSNAIDYFGNKINYTISGTVNMNQTGSNIITYTAIQNGVITNVTRTVIIVNQNYTITQNSQISYDVTNGWLGPITSNYQSMNGVDWTVECWVYCNGYRDSFIFDSRMPGLNNGPIICGMLSNGYLYIWSNNWSTNLTSKTVPINQWSHLVWMRYNNNLYCFINGTYNLIQPIQSSLNTLSNTTTFTLASAGNSPGNNLFNGLFCQPLITLGAKYNILGFTPQWDLTPSSYYNVLLWLQNGIDVISRKTIKLNNTIIKKTLTTAPFTSTISLVGNSNYNILVGNNYIEPGIISKTVYNILLPVYITSIKDINNNELLVESFIYVDGKYTSISNNLINTTNPTTYTITYNSIDSSNGLILTIKRTVNVVNTLPIIAYDVSAGYLGPISKNNLNNSNWTIECWIYQTSNSQNADIMSIFDFRDTNPETETHLFFTYLNNNTNKIGIWKSDSGGWSTNNESSTTVSLNTWTHLVWMRYNNNIYTFINGVCSLIESSPSWINSLININSITVGVDVFWQYAQNNGLIHDKFLGQIAQPLISLGAKYSVSGFTPVWDLTPSTYSNVLFWLKNGVDVISGNTITLDYTVNQIYENTSPIVPIINLNGLVNTYILVNSTYTDLGVSVNYILNPNIIPYITSITDSNGNEYIDTPLNALSTNIISNIDTTILNSIYTITYSVTYNNNNVTVNRYVNITNFPVNDIFFWIDPSDSSTITNDSNNNIALIKDKSINNIQMIHYNINSNYAKINNSIYMLPVIDTTNGSGLISNNVYNFPTNSILTFAGIVMFTTNVNNYGTILAHYHLNNGHTNPLHFRYETNSNVNLLTSNQDPWTCLLPINTNNIPYMFIGTFSNGVKNLTLISLLDGTKQTISKTAPVSVDQSNGNIIIGVSDSNEKINSYIGEEMYWQRLLSTTEQNNIMSYLYLKWSSYRNITPILILNGNSISYVYINNTYTDLGVTLNYILNPNLIPYITSITDTNGNQYITTPINASTSNIISNLNTTNINTSYIITYTVNNNNNLITITRQVNIINI